eukprot:gene905-1390_t
MFASNGNWPLDKSSATLCATGGSWSWPSGAVRVGDEVHELRSVLAPLPDKLSALEQRDPSSLSFAQAAKLVGMGATVDELTQSCGLTQAEAQLMSRLHKDS